MISIIL